MSANRTLKRNTLPELSSLRRRISAALVRDFTAEHITHFANYPIWLRIAQASIVSAFARHAQSQAGGKRRKCG